MKTNLSFIGFLLLAASVPAFAQSTLSGKRIQTGTLPLSALAQGSATDGTIAAYQSGVGAWADASIAAAGGISLSFSGGTFTISLTAPVSPANGGTGQSNSGAAGDILIGQGSSYADETVTGDATISSSGVLALKNTGTPGTYGDSSHSLTVTTDAKGRVTSVSTNAISAGGIPFPTWSSGTTYSTGQVVYGSDGNLYRCIDANTASSANDPVWTSGAGDNGTYWQLYQLFANITLNTGPGNQFAGSLTDPAGIQQGVNFVANAIPGGGTCTIQPKSNPSATATGGSSTTSFTSATYLPVSTVVLFKSGTSANIGKSAAVTAVSGTGPYTYTLASGSGNYNTSGLSATPANGDAFVYSYGYGTNTIVISNVAIGPWLTIFGSTNTVCAPSFYPSLTSASSGGSLPPIAYDVALTYTWVDASGTTRETLAGPVTQITVGGSGSGTLTIAGFTLPAGTTGVNVYVDQGAPPGSGNSYLHLQGSMSVSGGAATSYTLTSYNGSGANPPTVDPPAASYPAAMCWGSANGIVVAATGGITINGLFCAGNSTSGYEGIAIGQSQNVTIGPQLIAANWKFGVNTNGTVAPFVPAMSAGALNYIQTDNCGTGIGVAGSFEALYANALFCTTGFLVTWNGSIFGTNSYAGNSNTGYNASQMSFIYTPVTQSVGSGTVQQTFGSTTSNNGYSPAVNTAGNQNSYITH